jgi:hypothetical protein
MACRTLSSPTGLNNATALGSKLDVKGHKLGALANDDTSIVEEGSKTDIVASFKPGSDKYVCSEAYFFSPMCFLPVFKSIVSLIVLDSNLNVVNLVVFFPSRSLAKLMLVCHFELASTLSGLFPFFVA